MSRTKTATEYILRADIEYYKDLCSSYNHKLKKCENRLKELEQQLEELLSGGNGVC